VNGQELTHSGTLHNSATWLILGSQIVAFFKGSGQTPALRAQLSIGRWLSKQLPIAIGVKTLTVDIKLNVLLGSIAIQ
jgi:hypothetical protein